MKTAKTREQVELEVIKTRLTDFDLALPGTVRRIFLKCGKPVCACRKDKSARHGPYFLWDRKVGARLSSMSIDSEDLPLLKRWIENRRKLEEHLLKVLSLSQAIAKSLIEQTREERKQTKQPNSKE